MPKLYVTKPPSQYSDGMGTSLATVLPAGMRYAMSWLSGIEAREYENYKKVFGCLRGKDHKAPIRAGKRKGECPKCGDLLVDPSLL